MKAESSVNLPEMDLKVFTWEPTPSLVACLGKDSIKHFLLSEKSNFIIKKFPSPLPSKEGLAHSYYILKYHAKPAG